MTYERAKTEDTRQNCVTAYTGRSAQYKSLAQSSSSSYIRGDNNTITRISSTVFRFRLPSIYYLFARARVYYRTRVCRRTVSRLGRVEFLKKKYIYIYKSLKVYKSLHRHNHMTAAEF